jgi:8-oxo-dGTP diphosphatase
MIQVAVGILTGAGGRVLICRRPEGKPYAHQWEFPGGKIEPGERPDECLRRELHEELGIDAIIGDLFHVKSHTYPDSGEYNVYYFLVPSYAGTLRNQAFAEMQWVLPGEIPRYDNLEGNREVIEKLTRRA